MSGNITLNYDTTAPSISSFTLTPTGENAITNDNSGSSSATSYDLLVTFNESVTLVTANTLFSAKNSSGNDVGTLGDITGSGTSYSASYAIANTENSQSVIFGVPASSVRDSASNENSSTGTITLAYTPLDTTCLLYTSDAADE